MIRYRAIVSLDSSLSWNELAREILCPYLGVPEDDPGTWIHCNAQLLIRNVIL